MCSVTKASFQIKSYLWCIFPLTLLLPGFLTNKYFQGDLYNPKAIFNKFRPLFGLRE